MPSDSRAPASRSENPRRDFLGDRAPVARNAARSVTTLLAAFAMATGCGIGSFTTPAYAHALLQQEPVDPERARPVSPDPWPERSPDAEREDRNLRDLEDSADRRRSSPTVRPNQPGQTRAVGPGVEPAIVASYDPSVGVRRPLVPEGTFLANRRGRIAIARTGEHVFIFDRDADGRAEPPMVVAPCTHLTALETMTGQLPPNARYIISGQVFVYANVNYLVLAAPPLLELPPATPPAASRQEQPTDDQPAPTTETPPATETPDAESLIAELEAAVGPARRPLDAPTTSPSATTAPTTTPGAVQPPSTAVTGTANAITAAGLPPAQRLLPEGTLLASRRGRLVRSDQGQWVFAFDAGASQGSSAPATRDRPLIILPCLLLQDMERNAHRLGDSAAMTVSGRVYLYAGRNYLLPTMFRLDRHSDDIASAH